MSTEPSPGLGTSRPGSAAGASVADADDAAGGGRVVDRLLAVALGALCLKAYVATLTPGLAFPAMDTHELTLNAIRLGVAHPSGYPLYTWIGFLWVHLLPVGTAAHRMNLLSAVMAAGAVGLVFFMARTLGLGRLAAGTAAVLLGVSDTFWSQAVITEVYTTNLVLQTTTMLVLLRWARRVRDGGDGDRLFLAFACLFGASLGTHLSNLGFAPVYAAFVLAVDPAMIRRPNLIAGAFALFCLAAGQYVWLFVRGSSFDQYPNPEPNSLRGIWDYTLGAFASARFAFPLPVLPLRLVFYLQQLLTNFTVAGVALGVLGTWIALARAPAVFWLLFGIHVVNVFVFAQFSVPDPQVFFLPGYVAWAAFAAYGLQGLFDAAALVFARLAAAGRGIARVAYGATTVAIAVTLFGLAEGGQQSHDRTHDTIVPDFNRNVYDLLPANSAVLAPRGIFGASMMYWQAAEHLRPDVLILGQRGAPPWSAGTPLFATLEVANGTSTRAGRIGRRDTDMPLPEGWYVPVLFGNSRRLTLSRVDARPPSLIAAPPAAEATMNRTVGDVTLVGAAVSSEHEAPSPRLHVESWWRVPDARRVVVSTRLDDRTLEAHLLGLDNLARYAADVGLPPGAVVHENFHVVVPSTLPVGMHAVQIGVTTFGSDRIATERIDVGTIAVR